MNEISEAAGFLSSFKSGLDIVVTSLSVLSVGACGVRWLVSANPEETRKAKVSAVYVLTAYALYLMIPAIMKLLVSIAQTVG